MGSVTYLNKQAKPPRKEGWDSQWNTHLACGKDEKFSYEEETRIDFFLSSPYSERPDTHLLAPLIRHIQICSPGIGKLFEVCTEIETEELFVK